MKDTTHAHSPKTTLNLYPREMQRDVNLVISDGSKFSRTYLKELHDD